MNIEEYAKIKVMIPILKKRQPNSYHKYNYSNKSGTVIQKVEILCRLFL
ncbi:MAG: hypothetical protein ACPKPY_08270 [Nitrososphaeraceae archaeon]